MPAFLGGRRKRIRTAYEALCASIATALGGTSAAAERVRRQHLDALVELWLRERGMTAARADPELAPVFASSGMADVVRRLERESASLAAPDQVLPTLSDIVADAAVGAAGAPGTDWLDARGDVDGSDRLPGLWRIGTGRLGGSAPFDVAVPFLDESHLQISTADQRTREAGIALAQCLLMRVLSTVAPGTAVLHVWDVGQLTGPLPDLHPLTRTGLLTVHDPAGLGPLLEELSDRIRRVHNRVLVDGHQSLAEVPGARPEPWVVAVLVGNRQAMRDEDHRQLQRIARGGLACGVHLLLVDVPMAMGASVETVDLTADGLVRSSMTGPHMLVTPDEAPASAKVTAACHAIATEHETRRARIGTFADLLASDEEFGTVQSLAGLHAPIGFVDGRPTQLALVDSSPHALVAGPSGSGKTNLLLSMISAMATRYGPDELEFYLLDFKEGVSFAQFTGRDGTFLPHARLIGVNINTDREFGLALLRFLSAQMRHRAEVARAAEVTKLEDLREDIERRRRAGQLRPDEVTRWPRIVAVIDEFQYLFAARDAVTREAIQLLEDVARRGRSQGIHLVLASQDVSGIEAFWGRPAIFEQFVLRIALPRARRILDERNEAALDLPRWHAVVNHESGIRHGNEIVRVPNASVRGTVDDVRRRLYEAFGHDRPPPLLFDGSRAPRTEDLLAALGHGSGTPIALVGQRIDVAGSPAAVRLPAAPGRNLGVFGPGQRDAARILDAAGAGLAQTFADGAADVVLAPLVPDARVPAERLAARFAARRHGTRTVPLEEFGGWLEQCAADVKARLAGTPGRPVVVVLYAADAADSVLDRPGTEALRTLIHFGPEVGVHVLGWWRSVPRLKALLMMGATVDDLGAWVALDVQGSELSALLPGMLLSWSPRPGRGLWFDRAQHADPEVIIVPAAEEDQ